MEEKQQQEEDEEVEKKLPGLQVLHEWDFIYSASNDRAEEEG